MYACGSSCASPLLLFQTRNGDLRMLQNETLLAEWTIPMKSYLPSGLFHPYQMDESISILRGGWCTFFIFILF